MRRALLVGFVLVAALAGAHDFGGEILFHFNAHTGDMNMMVFGESTVEIYTEDVPEGTPPAVFEYHADDTHLLWGPYRFRYEVVNEPAQWPRAARTVIYLYWDLTEEQEPDEHVRWLVNSTGLAGRLE